LPKPAVAQHGGKVIHGVALARLDVVVGIAEDARLGHVDGA